MLRTTQRLTTRSVLSVFFCRNSSNRRASVLAKQNELLFGRRSISSSTKCLTTNGVSTWKRRNATILNRLSVIKNKGTFDIMFGNNLRRILGVGFNLTRYASSSSSSSKTKTVGKTENKSNSLPKRVDTDSQSNHTLLSLKDKTIAELDQLLTKVRENKDKYSEINVLFVRSSKSPMIAGPLNVDKLPPRLQDLLYAIDLARETNSTLEPFIRIMVGRIFIKQGLTDRGFELLEQAINMYFMPNELIDDGVEGEKTSSTTTTTPKEKKFNLIPGPDFNLKNFISDLDILLSCPKEMAEKREIYLKSLIAKLPWDTDRLELLIPRAVVLSTLAQHYDEVASRNKSIGALEKSKEINQELVNFFEEHMVNFHHLPADLCNCMFQSFYRFGVQIMEAHPMGGAQEKLDREKARKYLEMAFDLFNQMLQTKTSLPLLSMLAKHYCDVVRRLADLAIKRGSKKNESEAVQVLDTAMKNLRSVAPSAKTHPLLFIAGQYCEKLKKDIGELPAQFD